MPRLLAASPCEYEGKEENTMKKKSFMTVLALVLVLSVAVSGVVAWLTDKTGTVTNTFTVGDINIELTENGAVSSGDGNATKDYKLMPGVDLEKDPKVTVKAGSEACWLFVKVTENHWPTYVTTTGKNKVAYSVITEGENKWVAVDGHPGYYYMKVDATTADKVFPVLNGNKIVVSDELNKAELVAMKDNPPTLTFVAAAVQQDQIADVGAAWNALPSEFTN